MNKKITQKEQPKLREDWNEFFTEFANESDRAAAVLSAAYIDELLKNLIANFLVDDEKVVEKLLDPKKSPHAPLGTFSARITAAFCLGLIDRVQYDDLNIIRQIRNLFAHSLHGVTFKSAEVVKEVKKLKAHRLARIVKDTRGEFILTVAILSTDIEIQAQEISSHQRSIPSYYDINNE